MADESVREPGENQGGSRMPARNREDEQAAADMGRSEGDGAQGDAADRAEVDRPDLNKQLNNQDVE